MKHRAWLQVTLILFVSWLSIGCFCIEGLAYKDDLPGDYAVWAVGVREWASIVKRLPGSPGSLGEEVVGPMVYAYGWNDEFIIAKQHPLVNVSSIDPTTTLWYIIDLHSDTVHGPLTEEQYTDLRSAMQIPPQLTFTETIEP
jgi:hypothetical protein